MFPFAGAKEKIKALTGPKYDGKHLHKLVKEKLGDIRLHQTLTNVVIPTFDIKRLHPIIFSSYEVYISITRIHTCNLLYMCVFLALSFLIEISIFGELIEISINFSTHIYFNNELGEKKP